jgi:hypothetical protein
MYEADYMGLLEEQADALSGDEDFDGIAITGDDVEEAAYSSVLGASSAPEALSILSRLNIPGNARLSQASKARVAALSTGARAVIRVAEAQSARDALRPNSYCGFASGRLVAQGTDTITIQPGGGNGTWKFLGFYFPDDVQGQFVVTSLTIAGQQVIYGTSTGTGGGGVSLGVFGSRSPWNLNLTPWMGRTFLNNQNIVVTVRNQLATTDYYNGAPFGAGSLQFVGAVLTQVDPCNVSLPGVDARLSRKQVVGATRNALSAFSRPVR